MNLSYLQVQLRWQIMNKHWWGDFYSIAKVIHYWYLTCRAHNPGKSIFVPRGLRPPPSGPDGTCSRIHSNATQEWLSVCSCCVYVFQISGSLPLLQGWGSQNRKEIVRKCVFHLGVYLPQSSVMEASTFLGKAYQPDPIPCKCHLELSLSLSPSTIRQGGWDQ